MEKKPSRNVHQISTDSVVVALDSFEQTKEELDRQYDELMVLLGKDMDTHTQFKVDEIIYYSMRLGFLQGMKFQHYADLFFHPLSDDL